MGETIRLTAEDSHQLAAYRAAPAGTPRGALVVVQEIFGVNSHIKNVTDGFARDGYLAVAPAIFDRVERDFAIGYQPEDIERGRAVRGKISLDDMVKDLRAAVTMLRAAGHKVGVVGYCLGGSLAWCSSTGARPTSPSRPTTGRRWRPRTPACRCTSTRRATASAATSAGATTSRAPGSRASARSRSSASTSAERRPWRRARPVGPGAGR